MKKGDSIEVRIEKMAFGGKGLGYIDLEDQKFVIFVDGALEGQLVEARITKKKKSFAEGKTVRIIEPAKYEISDTTYQQISGAPWFAVPIEKQMKWKADQVKELFSKFADESINFDEVLASPELWNYRNKMEYSFGPTSEAQVEEVWVHSGFGLGFKKRGQYWLVESLQRPSGLFDEVFERLMPQIEAWCKSSDLEVYNQKTHKGFWRNLLVRKSFSEDKLLICMVVSHLPDDNSQHSKLEKDFVGLLKDALGDRLGGVFWQTSDSVSDSVKNYKERTLLYGDEVLVESINSLSFEISLDSFFQTNPASAEKLYDKVCSYVDSGFDVESSGINPESVVLDLFCGTGTIGQIIKSQNSDAKVIGVEIVEQAILDAKANAKRNNLEGLEFFAGDVGKFLKHHPEYGDKIDIVVLDPPRAGIAPKTLQKVIDLKSKSIIYVSCNPATLARDTALLTEAGYDLNRVSMVDQFPHTSHVECIAQFDLN